VNDVRVVLVKLADRLTTCARSNTSNPKAAAHFPRNAGHLCAHRAPPWYERRSCELEDLAFRYLEPEAFFALQKESAISAAPQEFLEESATIKPTGRGRHSRELESRVKFVLRAPQNRAPGIGLGQVYDLLAVRVITDSERNCYARGVVHTSGVRTRPLQGLHRHRPAKSIQSLPHHVLHSGQPLSANPHAGYAPHREEGVARTGNTIGKPSSQDDDQRITWMRQLIEWSQELQNPASFSPR